MRFMMRVKVGRGVCFINMMVIFGFGKSNIGDLYYWVEEGGYVELNGIIFG